ncbi:single-stranded DNA-binding protein [Carnobacteriaceae bacterium zg-ZUI240]|nr:single-stranded DNA-binding protein [Carnobacteriaceae bacterium zg-ZUI240]
MNVVTLIGRLTRDVELRYTPNGNAVGRFSLAVNRRVPNQNGERVADFINCVIWNKPAETLAQYTKKGALIGVQGRIQTGSYEKEGQRIYTTDVVVENFDFLESKGSNESQVSTAQFHSQQTTAPQNNTTTQVSNDFEMFEISDDDLPF